MAIGLASANTNLSGTANRLVQLYNPSTQTVAWSKMLRNSDKRVNVYFTDSDTKVLINWAETTSGAPRQSFAFLNSADGSFIGDIIQSGLDGGNI